MSVSFMKICTYRFYAKCNFSEVGVDQIFKIETQVFRAVDCVNIYIV